MPDFHTPEDEATLYVLGELPAEERRDFEARMAKSADLRRMVRELEEGMVALASGLPRRRPPAEIWSGIEKAVGRKPRAQGADWWKIFLRSGWAAAAVCVMGWLIYAILLNSHREPKISTAHPDFGPIAAANMAPATDHVAIPPPRSTNNELQLLQVRADEIKDLRLKIAAMAQETNTLSQLLAQERARLAETNRMKIYQFTSTLASGNDAPAPQLSPAMQRALLISIGRELGLMSTAAKSSAGPGPSVNTINGIDFVDLRPSSGNPANQPASQSPESPANHPPGQPRTESQLADVTEPSIPAVASGDKLVVGLDPAVVPTNSAVTLSIAGTSVGLSSSVSMTSWDLVMGQNPTMVTVPFSAGSFGSGLTLTVSSVTASGISNVTQFFTITTP